MKSRRGFVFTLIAILLVTLMLVYVGAKYRVRLVDRAEAQGQRIHQLTTLVADMENQYLPTAVISVSRDVLDAMAESTVPYGGSGNTPYRGDAFLKDFSSVMLEGRPSSFDADLNEGIEFTLPAFLDMFVARVESLFDVDIEYTVESVSIDHHDPFWLYSRAVITYTLTDPHTGLVYERRANVAGNFSIIGLQDPLYLYRTDRAMENIIEASAFLDLAEHTPTHINELIGSRNYTPDRDLDALSYLERFVGVTHDDLECSRGCGIVSLLDPQNAKIEGGYYSFADYTYGLWGGKCQDQQLWVIKDPAGGPSPPSTFYLNGHFVGANPFLQGGLFNIAPEYKKKVSDENADPGPPTRTCQNG